MPNIKANEKHLRKSIRRRLRNKAVKSNAKTAVKRAIEAAAAGSPDAQALLREAIRKLDKAAAKGIIHKNAAARRKRRLMARVRACAS